MGGRDHSCEVCGRGGFNNDEECVCPPDPREHPVEGRGATDLLRGRRLPDTPFGDLPDGFEPGDFWKYLDRESGEPSRSSEQTNLTATVWGLCGPAGSVHTLTKHTVREHDDRSISVRPGDGSSNSIALSWGPGMASSWHGYIEAGEWSVA